MDLRARTCCFTGHRNLSSGEKLKAAVRLRESLRNRSRLGLCFTEREARGGSMRLLRRLFWT